MNENRETLVLEQGLTQLRKLTEAVWDWQNITYKREVLKNRKRIDAVLEVRTKDGKYFNLYTELKTEFRLYHVSTIVEMSQQHTPFLLIAERIYPAQKQILKEKGINYMDTAGNIFFHFDQLYLYVEGNKPVDEVKPVANRAFTRAGLKTVFHFLLDEQLLNMPYRMLAQASGTSLGSINYIMEGLDQAGFILQIDSQTKKLQQKKLLLERWITAYHQTLKPSLYIGSFSFEKKNLSGPEQEQVWGGEPAAEILINHLSPQYYTVYTLKNKMELMRHWKLIPKEEGNLKAYQKFWTAPAWDAQQLAPPLLIYADLLETNDPRNIETAGIIYDQYLKNEFE